CFKRLRAVKANQAFIGDKLPAVGMHCRRNRNPPQRPIDAPALNIIGVETAVIGMPAVAVHRELLGNLYKFVPFPYLIVLETRRLNAHLIKEFGIIVEMW